MTLGTVVAVAALGVPIAAGTASAAATAARAEVVASGPDATFPAALGALACRSLTNCMAIGANTPQMATQMIAERWNGSRWSRLTMPKPAGVDEVANGGVACPSNGECVAVGVGYPAPSSRGSFFPIAGYWNGSRWTAGRAASSGMLSAVSCPAVRSCYAVGNYTPKGTSEVPLIEHWNGAKWSKQAAPAPRGASFAILLDVSCSSAKFCVAVGMDGSGVLIERWNGTRWSVSAPRSAPSAMLNGVSCQSASSCFAVGSNLTTRGGSLVERWNGRTWSQSTTTVPRNASYAGLQSVSCVSATHCLAVGDYVTNGVYTVSWNGRGWHLVSMTTTGGHLGDLFDVICLAATSCVALGGTTQFAATDRSESAFWNGTRWKVVLTA